MINTSLLQERSYRKMKNLFLCLTTPEVVDVLLTLIGEEKEWFSTWDIAFSTHRGISYTRRYLNMLTICDLVEIRAGNYETSKGFHYRINHQKIKLINLFTNAII